MFCCFFVMINYVPVVLFPFIRADKGKDRSLFLQLEMVVEITITALTMDMPTVCLL